MRILAGDPSTQTYAALHGWSHPMSYEAIAVAAVFDRIGALARLRGKFTYPYPWEKKDAGSVKQLGDTGGRTKAQVLEILARHGHRTPEQEGAADAD